jgi:hypothetical protein
MIVLSYGFKQPEDGDASSIWFPALADNVLLTNNHTHDGVNSSLISLSSAPAITLSILAINWTLVSTGIYTQTVAVPTGATLDANVVQFKLSTGEVVYPTVKRLTSTSFSIRTNDNTLNYTAVFR